MANITRRSQRCASKPALQLSGICLLLVLGLYWLIAIDPIYEVGSAARPTTSLQDNKVNWVKFQYVQYVGSPVYLCNALLVWSEIEEIGSRASRTMLYPSRWDDEPDPAGNVARLLRDAEEKYFVKLRPLDALNQVEPSSPWIDPYSKLLAFNLTEYDRVLVIDPDSAIISNLDQLFLFPAAPLAMPYVYWGSREKWRFSSHLMLVSPSVESFSAVESAVKEAEKDDDDDIHILHKLYKGQIVHIPQRPYALLAREFRRQDHSAYSNRKTWDAEKIFQQAKLLHYADSPVPKPWVQAPQALLNKYMPPCEKSEWFGATDCRARLLWFGLYSNYAMKRESVCGEGFPLLSPEEGRELELSRNGRIFRYEDADKEI